MLTVTVCVIRGVGVLGIDSVKVSLNVLSSVPVMVAVMVISVVTVLDSLNVGEVDFVLERGKVSVRLDVFDGDRVPVALRACDRDSVTELVVVVDVEIEGLRVGVMFRVGDGVAVNSFDSVSVLVCVPVVVDVREISCDRLRLRLEVIS